jgi:thiol-disulfide isomerase/thioredoxin
MDSESLFEVLLESDVLAGGDDEESLFPNEAFLTAVERRRSELETGSESDLRRQLERTLDDEARVERLLGIDDTTDELYAEFLVLREFLDEVSFEDQLNLLTVVDQFDRGLPPAEGAPEHFLPVHGDQLPFLLSVHRRAIVYTWRFDCPPCDAVRADFEALLSRPPENIALFAVYGPDCPEFLYEEYDAHGAPTTMFVVDGAVDTRMQGAYYRESLSNEIDVLRGR